MIPIGKTHEKICDLIKNSFRALIRGHAKLILTIRKIVIPRE